MRELRNNTILIVDSSLEVIEDISLWLQKLGIHTVCAESAALGLGLLDIYAIQLLITQHPTQLEYGLEFWNEIKTKYPSLPVILLSEKRTDIEKFNSAGIPILIKPIDSTLLRDSVITALFPPNKLKTRVYERKPISQKTSWEASSQGTYLAGTIINISARGAFVRADAVLPELGSIIELESYFEDDELIPFQGLGIVRWTREANVAPFQKGFGLEFAFLSEKSEAYVEKLNSK